LFIAPYPGRRPKSVTHSAPPARPKFSASPSIFRNPTRAWYDFIASPRMAGTTPRSARVPHTEKRPERCPHCGSTAITRKGTRRKKIEIVQLWRCASCKRVFTPTPAALRNKTYPLRIVLDAITLYDLGYSLEQTAAKIKSRHGYQIAARPSRTGSSSTARSRPTRACAPTVGGSTRRRKRSAR
jgi:transposase-like protein